MNRPLKDSILLTTIEAFMAVAAFESYSAAGNSLGTSATTVMRRVQMLELWLRRVLIWTEERFCTEWGNDFVPVAKKILKLIEADGLGNELSKTRVHPDGVVTIEGQPINTPATLEIGKLMVKSRSVIGEAQPWLKTSGNDPMILAFLNSRNEKSEA